MLTSTLKCIDLDLRSSNKSSDKDSKIILSRNLQRKIQYESKCNMYKYLVDNFCLQFYLEKSIPKLYKKCIIEIRVSSHNLCIELDRHKKISRDKKFCMTCISTIEDEYHFILVCPVYNELRSKYLKKYNWGKPSMFKLTRLFSVYNVKELCNLGKYIF